MAKNAWGALKRQKRYWVAFSVAALAMVLVDTQSLNPLAKHTIALYLFGKTAAAMGCWYGLTKLFCPYSDMRADMEAARSSFAASRGELSVNRSIGPAANVIASALIRLAVAILVAAVWSTV